MSPHPVMPCLDGIRPSGLCHGPLTAQVILLWLQGAASCGGPSWTTVSLWMRWQSWDSLRGLPGQGSPTSQGGCLSKWCTRWMPFISLGAGTPL